MLPEISVSMRDYTHIACAPRSHYLLCFCGEKFRTNFPEKKLLKIAFIIAHTRNSVVVLFGTLKVQSFLLTEVRDCDLLIVVTSATFLKRKDMLKEKSS